MRKTLDDFYASLFDASIAAKALGISSLQDYQERYKKDPQLPSRPNKIYSREWKNWAHFLGYDFYASLSEASAAAKALSAITKSEYSKRYKQDPKLPSAPNEAYSSEWVSWPHFLGRKLKNHYPTLLEASKAAKALNMSGAKEYQENYKKDPRLPSDPSRFYADDWKSWTSFLGKKLATHYQTYAEASSAAQSLNIKTSAEYLRRYKEDKNLRSQPQNTYPDDWVCWQHFLGNEVKDPYRNFENAKSAVRKLNIETSEAYKTKYKDDPRLPATPDRVYFTDWISWPHFLGKEAKDFYLTYAEASEAAQRLKIITGPEYKERYKEDPLLPCDPNTFYDVAWKSWPDFLGNEARIKALEQEARIKKEYTFWREAIKDWLSQNKGLASKERALRVLLSEFIFKNGYPDHPATLLHKDTKFNPLAYEQFINSQSGSQKRVFHNIYIAFFEWVLTTYCTDEEEDLLLPGYRNPLTTILSGLAETLPLCRPGQSTKPVLPLSIVVRGRDWLFPEGKRTLKELTNLHDFFDMDWHEVDPKIIDKNDPNCVWRKRNKQIKRKKGQAGYTIEVTEIWAPIRAVALFTLLRVPLRSQQILWLDSGEGDYYKPIAEMNGDVQWVKNDNPLAVGKKRSQGFIQRGRNDQPYMYITTNKTGARKAGGYSIPWVPEDLLQWILLLRDWQEKYNPLEQLTPWTEIKLRIKTNKKTLKARGKQAFLFRNMNQDRKSPVSTAGTISRDLPKLLFAIQHEGESLAEKQGKKYSSPFTPHCLRVSLITAYVIDAKVPIQVISKLVGHASIVMTIYYTKIGQQQMRKELDEAEKRAMAEGVDRLQDLAYNKQIEQAKGELIAQDDGQEAINNEWPSSSFQFNDRGICPMGGGACSEGGEQILDREKETLYGPVPNGYLGQRNCIRCRYFITGPAFIGGLMALSNEISLALIPVKVEYNELEEEIEALKDQKYDCESTGQPFKELGELHKKQSIYEERALKLDMLLCDYLSTASLVSQCVALINTPSSEEKQLIVSSSFVEFGMELEDSSCEFRLLSEVCADATIYKSSTASHAVHKRSQMLDAMADANDLPPALFKLDDKQQLHVGNQITQLLKARLGSWEDMDRLIQGDIKLDDLSNDEALEPLSQSIKTLMQTKNCVLPVTEKNYA